jgi:hypothetical protein
MYTDSPQSKALHGLFCFGNVATLADVDASVEIDPSTGVRRGRVFGSDGNGSVDLRTTAPPPGVVIPAATLQHFTVENGEVHGRIEWGSKDAGVRQRGTESTLVLDGVPYPGIIGQHIFPVKGSRTRSSTPPSRAVRPASTGSTEPHRAGKPEPASPPLTRTA